MSLDGNDVKAVMLWKQDAPSHKRSLENDLIRTPGVHPNLEHRGSDPRRSSGSCKPLPQPGLHRLGKA